MVSDNAAGINENHMRKTFSCMKLMRLLLSFFLLATFTIPVINNSCTRSNQDCCNQCCSTTGGCCQENTKSDSSVSFLRFDRSCGTSIFMTVLSEKGVLVEKETTNYQLRSLPCIPFKNISKPAYPVDGSSIQSYLKFDSLILPSAAKFILNSAFLI